VELNDEFEAQYDTTEYETKISRLLHHAYDRLKAEDPEEKRTWDQAVRTLRKGDHYFLVLWDITSRSGHPTRDSLKLLGVGMLIAAGIAIAAVFAAKYNVDSHRFAKYVLALILGVYLLASGTFRLVCRAAAGWFTRGTTRDDESD
jgi:hypothetical protein